MYVVNNFHEFNEIEEDFYELLHVYKVHVYTSSKIVSLITFVNECVS